MCKLSSILNNAAKREEGFMDHFGKINLINYIVKFIHSTNGRIKLAVQVKRHKPWGDLRIRCTLYKVMAGLQNEVQDVYSDMQSYDGLMKIPADTFFVSLKLNIDKV